MKPRINTKLFSSVSTSTQLSATQRQQVAAAAVDPSKLEVAVIGFGAAGLAAARVLSRSGIGSVTVLEKDDDCGGVWSYRKDDKERPMYRGLRTNLPREIMAFKEKPWGGDGKGKSFVTHSEVKQYLSDYAKDFNLRRLVKFGCSVKQLTVEEDTPSLASPIPATSSSNESMWPKIRLSWDERSEESSTVSHDKAFDAVYICNGHYARPSSPNVPGLKEHFRGTVMHSIEYDDPSIFADKQVLCVGGRASGSDVAREISKFAKTVYLSDTQCPPLEGGKPQMFHNVCWIPRTEYATENQIHFGNDFSVPVSDIDVVIFCSGYDYDFPFIKSEASNLDLQFIPGERRVSPLYEQLWHARYPNIAFLGLPHSVLPFPLFEIQAEAVTAYLIGTTPEPIATLSQRMKAAEADAARGGPKKVGRVKDTHYLGSFQWDYCMRLAKMARGEDEEMERYIATNKAIYDFTSSERKSLFPGGPDTYRETKYIRKDEDKSFQVVHKDEDISKQEANGDPQKQQRRQQQQQQPSSI